MIAAGRLPGSRGYTLPTIISFLTLRRAAAAIGIFLFAGAGVGFGQGLADPNTVDTIIGSDVQEHESKSQRVYDRVLEAIEMTTANTASIRKVWRLTSVDIVYLPEAAAIAGGPSGALLEKMLEHRSEIDQMRQEFAGNAMLFHAATSRQVQITDIVAVTFDGNDKVTVFAATVPPG